MGLNAGSRLGPYEVIAPIGAGGMGTVYRARDTRLNRDVALKVLPESVTDDPDRVARFRREAQVLASINHVHIGGIHGIEDDAGVTALVLELVEGPTLAERIARRPLPLDEALPIARQIAEALEAAHDQGIVHRDLKPANIKVRPDGAVKVLDFGLAKAVDEAAAAAVSSAPTLALSATALDHGSRPSDRDRGVTQIGTILGTAAYMSPEQARGQAVDKRTDIWAFGCVLFEMLTAKPAFPGENVSDVVAGVLRGDPDWGALPGDTAPIAAVLRRCLEKDVKWRFRDIADVKLLLKDVVERAPEAVIPAARRTRSWRVVAAALVGLIAGGAAMALLDRSRTTTVPAAVELYDLSSPQTLPFTAETSNANVAISPDGSRIVYTSTRGGAPMLAVRSLDQLEPRPIAGTEGGFAPFFSPDGQRIGFATINELKSVPTAGGPPVVICPVTPGFTGASWAPDNSIVFTESPLGLFRRRLSGGDSEKLAMPDAARGEQSYQSPVVLPGGDAVLYTVLLSDGSSRITARRLTGGAETTIVAGGFGPRYLRSGHLLYGQGGRLMAVGFDAATLQVTGSPVPVQDGVLTKPVDGVANVSIANNGTIVYVAGHGTAQSHRLVWIDRRGTFVSAAVDQPLDEPRNLRISPDGRRAVVTIGPPNHGQIWVYDLAGAAQPLKLTFQDQGLFPIWSPDGKRIAFLTRAQSTFHLVSIAADGSAVQPDALTDSDTVGPPSGWSPDGALLIFQVSQPAQIWVLELAGRKTNRWLQTPFKEFGPSLSPDGRWVAYASDPTGSMEVWIRPFPGPGAPLRLSPDGGSKPIWSRDGKEVFYQNGAKLMSARVLATAPGFRAAAPQTLFEGGIVRDDIDPNLRFLDPAPDGRFLAVESTNAPASMVVAHNWAGELTRLLPGK